MQLALRNEPLGPQGIAALVEAVQVMDPKYVKIQELTIWKCDAGNEGTVALVHFRVLSGKSLLAEGDRQTYSGTDFVSRSFTYSRMRLGGRVVLRWASRLKLTIA